MKNFFFLVLGLTIVLGSLFLFLERSLIGENRIKIVKINDVEIAVEVADTTEARAQGLSGRESLPESSGMLFAFNHPARYGFWMKEMKFAIDIVWISEERRVVGVTKEILPETFPQIFYPSRAVKYVLELPAGWAEARDIDIGTSVYFKY